MNSTPSNVIPFRAADDSPVAIAVDTPRKRIYIACDPFKAYHWLLKNMLSFSHERVIWLPEPGVIAGSNGWTVEHKRPLSSATTEQTTPPTKET